MRGYCCSCTLHQSDVDHFLCSSVTALHLTANHEFTALSTSSGIGRRPRARVLLLVFFGAGGDASSNQCGVFFFSVAASVASSELASAPSAPIVEFWWMSCCNKDIVSARYLKTSMYTHTHTHTHAETMRSELGRINDSPISPTLLECCSSSSQAFCSNPSQLANPQGGPTSGASIPDDCGARPTPQPKPKNK